MPRKPVPCVGCHRLLEGGRASLPAGQRTCRKCRSAGLAPMPYRGRPAEGVRLCSIEGCDRKHLALGLCKPHWMKARRADGKDRRPPVRRTG